MGTAVGGLPRILEALGKGQTPGPQQLWGLLMEGCSFSSEGGCRGPAGACLLLLEYNGAPPCLGLSFLASQAVPCMPTHLLLLLLAIHLVRNTGSRLFSGFPDLLCPLPSSLLHTGPPLGIVALVGLLQPRSPFL